MELTQEDIYQSFHAVKQLLQDGKNMSLGGMITFNLSEGSQNNNLDINVTLLDHIPSYNLDNDVFKSYGLRNPLWSSYFLFKWDEAEKALVIEVNEHQTLKIKRTN